MHSGFTQRSNSTELCSEVHDGGWRSLKGRSESLSALRRECMCVDAFAQDVGAGPGLREGKVGAGRRVLVQ